jgi:hypothetical protein
MLSHMNEPEQDRDFAPALIGIVMLVLFVGALAGANQERLQPVYDWLMGRTHTCISLSPLEVHIAADCESPPQLNVGSRGATGENALNDQRQ